MRLKDQLQLPFAEAALFGSGAAALVYQVLWMRSFGLIFGNTTRATSIVLAVFMGGLALGGHLCKKWNFKNALKAYANLELFMAASALLSSLLLRQLPQAYAALQGGASLGGWAEFLLKTVAVAAITLPTAIAVGMTFPVMMECVSKRGLGFSRVFAGLYGVNTLGAAFGAVIASFLLIPSLGTGKTYFIAVAVNLMIGASAWRLSWDEEKTTVTPASGPVPATARPIPWLAFGSGFGAFLLEVVWVRSLVLVIGSSSYAFSVVLSSMLLGIALGAWVFQLLQARIRHTRAWLAWTCLSLSLMVLVSYAAMGSLPDIYMKAIERLRHSFPTFQFVNFLMSFFTLLLVTLPQGFLFPMLLSLYGKNETLGQNQVGRVYFWNTLGALAGALSAGWLLIPLAGFRVVYLLASLSSGLMGLWLMRGLIPSPAKKTAFTSLFFAVTLAIFIFYDPWRHEVMSMGIYENGFKILGQKKPDESLAGYFSRSGDSLLYYVEGKESLVSVRRLAAGSTILANNGKDDASDSGDISTQKLIAHIPFAYFPNAKSVYVIGWGSGSTAGSASLHPVEALDCVEIEPKVFEAAQWFHDVNFEVWKDPRFKIRFNDARNDLLASKKIYDLILSEPPNPWISGVSNLFTKEFYELAKSRLSENGVFSQWLPYYGMSVEDIQVQLRTFCQAFPQSQLWVLADSKKHLFLSGDLLLIGSVQNSKLDFNEIQKLFQNTALAGDFSKIGINDPWIFLSLQLLNHEEMLAFAGEGPLNTDGFPRIEFSAPRSHFRAGSESALGIQEIFSKLSSHKKDLYPALLHSPFDKSGLKKNQMRALGSLAAGYSAHSQFDQSLKVLDEMESLGMRNVATTYYRGVALFFSGKDIPGGISRLETAVKLNPNEKNFYNTLCLAYLHTKKFDDAYRIFSQGEKKWPEDVLFSFGQGMARYQAGRFSEAKAILEKVLVMNPTHSGAKMLLANILSPRPAPAPASPSLAPVPDHASK
jgi:spermidine synthase